MLNRRKKMNKLNTRQIKKDNSDSSNENYLESRNRAGEDNKFERKACRQHPLNTVDNQSAEIFIRDNGSGNLNKAKEDQDE